MDDRPPLFLPKLCGRVIRPGLRALDPRLTAQATPSVRTALAAVDTATAALIQEARLAPYISSIFVQTMGFQEC